MKKIFLLLLLAAACFAQTIIQGDPAEPCGPIRPDYWIGRKTNTPLLLGEGKGRGQTRQVPKHFSTALTDSYDFGANVRVNDDTPGWDFASPYSSGGHAMAARGDTVYLVWRDDRNTNSTVYFDKSTDGGNTWGTDVRITDSDSGAVMPALAVSKDGAIYVSWTDFRDASGYRHIYFAKSTNGGVSFLPSVRVSAESGEMPQQKSSIAVNDSGNIFIAYEDWRNYTTTAMDIYCSRSTDGGASFLPAARVDDCSDSVDQWEPCVAARDSSVYVVWTDWRLQPKGSRTYFGLSNNYGVSYGGSVLVVDTSGLGVFAASPSSMCCDNSNIYVSWQHTKTQNDVYFTKSADGGLTFIKPNINLIDAAGLSSSQGYPSLACDDSGGVYCAWEDRRNGAAYPWLVYFNYSKNYGDTFATNNIHVDDCSLSQQVQLYTPTLCANKQGKVFCAWADNRINSGGLTMDIYVTAESLDGVEGEPTENAKCKMQRMEIFPNPFKQMTSIKYSVGVNSLVQLKIYNIAGQLVKTLVNGSIMAGVHTYRWNGRDNSGNNISSGIYLICLNTGNTTKTQKITYIK